MNWLAHVFLSQNDIEHQLGNLLTDPLKAKPWQGASKQIERGMQMHLHIDTFTDTHPLVSKSKQLLTPRGYLKGVVLDVLYDHFLSQHWEEFCSIPREAFLETFRTQAIQSIQYYPSEAKRVINRVVANRQLASYEHMDGVVEALRRIESRLSPRALSKDTIMRYIPLIANEKEALESHFLNFFPELMQSVKSKCTSDNVAHWKL